MLIVGDGGIGKTSLLRKFEALACGVPESRGYCLSVDCGDFLYDLSELVGEMYAQLPEYAGKNTKQLLGTPLSATAKVFFSQLLQGLRDGVSVGVGFPPSVSVEFSPGAFLGREEHPRNLLKRCALLCDSIVALLPKLDGCLTILIDQLGKVADQPGGLILVRSLFELVKRASDNSRLLIVVAVRPERKGKLEHWFREDIFHPQYFTRFPLYPLDTRSARQVVCEPAARQGITLSDALVDQVVAQAGRRPYFLQ